jgi:nitrite reductase (NADH) small subunit
MSTLVALINEDEIPAGSARAFDVGGRRIALYRTASGFFATDNQCPHRGGPLAEGDLVGDRIICPWHVWTFDLRTGANDVDPEKCVTTHEVVVESGVVYVRIVEAAEVACP